MNFLLKAEVQKLQARANEQVDLYCFSAFTSDFQFIYTYIIGVASPRFTHVDSGQGYWPLMSGCMVCC